MLVDVTGIYLLSDFYQANKSCMLLELKLCAFLPFLKVCNILWNYLTGSSARYPCTLMILNLSPFLIFSSSTISLGMVNLNCPECSCNVTDILTPLFLSTISRTYSVLTPILFSFKCPGIRDVPV